MKDGDFTLNDEFITINDRSRRDYWLGLLFGVASLLHGIVGGFKWLRDGEMMFIVVYGFLCLVMVPFLIMVLRTSTASRIMWDDVKNVKIRERLGKVMVTLRLKNGMRRRLQLLPGHASELRSFVAANLPA